MATDVSMPRLSDSMEEGTVLKWLVEEGAEIKRGQEIAEIETDKANMTYEADAEGTLIEIVAKEGDTVAIGDVIARLGEAGEAPSAGTEGDGASAPAEEADEGAGESEGRQAEQPVATEAPSGSAEETGAEAGRATSTDGGDGRVKASPVARRIATEMGVEIGSLQGSGPGGRIVKADVLAAAEGGDGASAREAEEVAAPAATTATEDKPEPPPSERAAAGDAGAKGTATVEELTRLQKTVARRMAEAKATAPDFQIRMEVDMSAAIELRRQLKQVMDRAPSFNDMVVKACALALREFPRVNGSYKDGAFELYSRINVGIAVAAQDALVVPTIFDADKKSLGEIAREARALAAKVREGNISPPELSGGTFTVSNLGMFGVDDFIAVINAPQAAILSVGAMKKTPAFDDAGRVVARETMGIRLSGDHRILYGADGAEFLADVRKLLEQPLALAL